MRTSTLFFVLLADVIYLVFGAVIFYFIEKDEEARHIKAARDFHQEFIVNVTQCVSREELLNYLSVFIDAASRGVFLLGNESAPTHTDWDLSNSFYFVSNVITTIGYGDSAPNTDGGKVFLIIFAIFGIPITFAFLTGLGERIARLSELVAARVNLFYRYPNIEKWSDAIILFVLGFTGMILLPAVVFYLVEGWGYTTSVYFCFVTVTTIGLGDYVPGGYESGAALVFYRIFGAVWTALGMAWLAGVITVIQTHIQSQTEEAIETVKEEIEHHLDSSDEEKDETNSDIEKNPKNSKIPDTTVKSKNHKSINSDKNPIKTVQTDRMPSERLRRMEEEYGAPKKNKPNAKTKICPEQPYIFDNYGASTDL